MPALPPKSPPTPTTPTIFLTPLTSTLISPVTPIINTRDITATTSISRSSSHQNIDTDSGKSSCSPALLDCSFDSGIGVDGEHGKNMKLHKCLQQWKRILIALERDKETYRMLRDRLSKIVDKKSKKQTNEETFCNVCCTEINLNNAKSFVTCCICKKHICRGAKCCDWLSKTAQWECQLCHSSKESLAQTSSWVAEQMSFNQQKLVYPMRARSEIYIPISDCNDGSMQFESVSQIGVNSSIDISAEQKVKIREYVEEVVANMLGGSLDSIRVEQMSKSENYLPAVINGNSSRRSTNNLTTNTTTTTNNNNDHIDFADISQTRLRQLIESIIGETLRMSNISSSGAVSEIALDTYNARNKKDANRALPLTNGCVARRHRTEHYFEPQIYQDLLATAVLNKIVDNQGNNVRHLSESTPDLNSHTVDANFNVENRSTTSGSSVEPRSDCSSTDTEQRTNVGKGDDMSPCDSQQNLHADNITAALLTAGRESALSNYIAAHMVPLPDLSAAPTESEEDDYVSVTSSTLGEGTWEDNWLFKKKRASLKTPVTAGSVGMLVPAPKEDIRAQIGDKTADEVSDLSEMGSDTDESSMDLLRANLDPLNDRLLSKHLIGGQNTKQVLDEIMDRASMVSSTSPASNEPTYTETKNEHVVDAATKTEAVNTSVAQLQVPAANVEILTPPSEFKDLQAETIATSNPISAAKLIEALREHEGCTGFGTVEVFDSDPEATECSTIFDRPVVRNTPSVIEILAAIALGPMLAVPASEQQTVLTPSEITSLKDLSDLALVEISERTSDKSYQTLGVIEEEIVDDNGKSNSTTETERATRDLPLIPIPFHPGIDKVSAPQAAIAETEPNVLENEAMASTAVIVAVETSAVVPKEATNVVQTKIVSGVTPAILEIALVTSAESAPTSATISIQSAAVPGTVVQEVPIAMVPTPEAMTVVSAKILTVSPAAHQNVSEVPILVSTPTKAASNVPLIAVAVAAPALRESPATQATENISEVRSESTKVVPVDTVAVAYAEEAKVILTEPVAEPTTTVVSVVPSEIVANATLAPAEVIAAPVTEPIPTQPEAAAPAVIEIAPPNMATPEVETFVPVEIITVPTSAHAEVGAASAVEAIFKLAAEPVVFKENASPSVETVPSEVKAISQVQIVTVATPALAKVAASAVAEPTSTKPLAATSPVIESVAQATETATPAPSEVAAVMSVGIAKILTSVAAKVTAAPIAEPIHAAPVTLESAIIEEVAPPKAEPGVPVPHKVGPTPLVDIVTVAETIHIVAVAVPGAVEEMVPPEVELDVPAKILTVAAPALAEIAAVPATEPISPEALNALAQVEEATLSAETIPLKGIVMPVAPPVEETDAKALTTKPIATPAGVEKHAPTISIEPAVIKEALPSTATAPPDVRVVVPGDKVMVHIPTPATETIPTAPTAAPVQSMTPVATVVSVETMSIVTPTPTAVSATTAAESIPTGSAGAPAALEEVASPVTTTEIQIPELIPTGSEDAAVTVENHASTLAEEQQLEIATVVPVEIGPIANPSASVTDPISLAAAPVPAIVEVAPTSEATAPPEVGSVIPVENLMAPIPTPSAVAAASVTNTVPMEPTVEAVQSVSPPQAEQSDVAIVLSVETISVVTATPTEVSATSAAESIPAGSAAAPTAVEEVASPATTTEIQIPELIPTGSEDAAVTVGNHASTLAEAQQLEIATVVPVEIGPIANPSASVTDPISLAAAPVPAIVEVAPTSEATAPPEVGSVIPVENLMAPIPTTSAVAAAPVTNTVPMEPTVEPVQSVSPPQAEQSDVAIVLSVETISVVTPTLTEVSATSAAESIPAGSAAAPTAVEEVATPATTTEIQIPELIPTGSEDAAVTVGNHASTLAEAQQLEIATVVPVEIRPIANPSASVTDPIYLAAAPVPAIVEVAPTSEATAPPEVGSVIPVENLMAPIPTPSAVAAAPVTNTVPMEPTVEPVQSVSPPQAEQSDVAIVLSVETISVVTPTPTEVSATSAAESIPAGSAAAPTAVEEVASPATTTEIQIPELIPTGSEDAAVTVGNHASTLAEAQQLVIATVVAVEIEAVANPSASVTDPISMAAAPVSAIVEVAPPSPATAPPEVGTDIPVDNVMVPIPTSPLQAKQNDVAIVLSVDTISVVTPTPTEVSATSAAESIPSGTAAASATTETPIPSEVATVVPVEILTAAEPNPTEPEDAAVAQATETTPTEPTAEVQNMTLATQPKLGKVMPVEILMVVAHAPAEVAATLVSTEPTAVPALVSTNNSPVPIAIGAIRVAESILMQVADTAAIAEKAFPPAETKTATLPEGALIVPGEIEKVSELEPALTDASHFVPTECVGAPAAKKEISPPLTEAEALVTPTPEIETKMRVENDVKQVAPPSKETENLLINEVATITPIENVASHSLSEWELEAVTTSAEPAPAVAIVQNVRPSLAALVSVQGAGGPISEAAVEEETLSLAGTASPRKAKDAPVEIVTVDAPAALAAAEPILTELAPPCGNSIIPAKAEVATIVVATLAPAEETVPLFVGTLPTEPTAGPAIVKELAPPLAKTETLVPSEVATAVSVEIVTVVVTTPTEMAAAIAIEPIPTIYALAEIEVASPSAGTAEEAICVPNNIITVCTPTLVAAAPYTDPIPTEAVSMPAVEKFVPLSEETAPPKVIVMPVEIVKVTQPTPADEVALPGAELISTKLTTVEELVPPRSETKAPAQPGPASIVVAPPAIAGAKTILTELVATPTTVEVVARSSLITGTPITPEIATVVPVEIVSVFTPAPDAVTPVTNPIPMEAEAVAALVENPLAITATPEIITVVPVEIVKVATPTSHEVSATTTTETIPTGAAAMDDVARSLGTTGALTPLKVATVVPFEIVTVATTVAEPIPMQLADALIAIEEHTPPSEATAQLEVVTVLPVEILAVTPTEVAAVEEVEPPPAKRATSAQSVADTVAVAAPLATEKTCSNAFSTEPATARVTELITTKSMDAPLAVEGQVYTLMEEEDRPPATTAVSVEIVTGFTPTSTEVAASSATETISSEPTASPVQSDVGAVIFVEIITPTKVSAGICPETIHTGGATTSTEVGKVPRPPTTTEILSLPEAETVMPIENVEVGASPPESVCITPSAESIPAETTNAPAAVEGLAHPLAETKYVVLPEVPPVIPVEILTVASPAHAEVATAKAILTEAIAVPAVVEEVAAPSVEISSHEEAKVFLVEYVTTETPLPVTNLAAKPVPTELTAVEEVAILCLQSERLAQTDEAAIAVSALSPAERTALFYSEVLPTEPVAAPAALEDVADTTVTTETLAPLDLATVVQVEVVSFAAPTPTEMATTPVAETISARAADELAAVEEVAPTSEETAPVEIVMVCQPVSPNLVPAELVPMDLQVLKDVEPLAETATPAKSDVDTIVVTTPLLGEGISLKGLHTEHSAAPKVVKEVAPPPTTTEIVAPLEVAIVVPNDIVTVSTSVPVSNATTAEYFATESVAAAIKEVHLPESEPPELSTVVPVQIDSEPDGEPISTELVHAIGVVTPPSETEAPDVQTVVPVDIFADSSHKSELIVALPAVEEPTHTETASEAPTAQEEVAPPSEETATPATPEVATVAPIQYVMVATLSTSVVADTLAAEPISTEPASVPAAVQNMEPPPPQATQPAPIEVVTTMPVEIVTVTENICVSVVTAQISKETEAAPAIVKETAHLTSPPEVTTVLPLEIVTVDTPPENDAAFVADPNPNEPAATQTAAEELAPPPLESKPPKPSKLATIAPVEIVPAVAPEPHEVAAATVTEAIKMELGDAPIYVEEYGNFSAKAGETDAPIDLSAEIVSVTTPTFDAEAFPAEARDAPAEVKDLAHPSAETAAPKVATVELVEIATVVAPASAVVGAAPVTETIPKELADAPVIVEEHGMLLAEPAQPEVATVLQVEIVTVAKPASVAESTVEPVPLEPAVGLNVTPPSLQSAQPDEATKEIAGLPPREGTTGKALPTEHAAAVPPATTETLVSPEEATFAPAEIVTVAPSPPAEVAAGVIADPAAKPVPMETAVVGKVVLSPAETVTPAQPEAAKKAVSTPPPKAAVSAVDPIHMEASPALATEEEVVHPPATTEILATVAPVEIVLVSTSALDAAALVTDPIPAEGTAVPAVVELALVEVALPSAEIAAPEVATVMQVKILAVTPAPAEVAAAPVTEPVPTKLAHVPVAIEELGRPSAETTQIGAVTVLPVETVKAAPHAILADPAIEPVPTEFTVGKEMTPPSLQSAQPDEATVVVTAHPSEESITVKETEMAHSPATTEALALPEVITVVPVEIATVGEPPSAEVAAAAIAEAFPVRTVDALAAIEELELPASESAAPVAIVMPVEIVTIVKPAGIASAHVREPVPPELENEPVAVEENAPLSVEIAQAGLATVVPIDIVKAAPHAIVADPAIEPIPTEFTVGKEMTPPSLQSAQPDEATVAVTAHPAEESITVKETEMAHPPATTEALALPEVITVVPVEIATVGEPPSAEVAAAAIAEAFPVRTVDALAAIEELELPASESAAPVAIVMPVEIVTIVKPAGIASAHVREPVPPELENEPVAVEENAPLSVEIAQAGLATVVPIDIVKAAPHAIVADPAIEPIPTEFTAGKEMTPPSLQSAQPDEATVAVTAHPAEESITVKETEMAHPPTTTEALALPEVITVVPVEIATVGEPPSAEVAAAAIAEAFPVRTVDAPAAIEDLELPASESAAPVAIVMPVEIVTIVKPAGIASAHITEPVPTDLENAPVAVEETPASVAESAGKPFCTELRAVENLASPPAETATLAQNEIAKIAVATPSSNAATSVSETLTPPEIATVVPVEIVSVFTPVPDACALVTDPTSVEVTALPVLVEEEVATSSVETAAPEVASVMTVEIVNSAAAVAVAPVPEVFSAGAADASTEVEELPLPLAETTIPEGATVVPVEINAVVGLVELAAASDMEPIPTELGDVPVTVEEHIPPSIEAVPLEVATILPAEIMSVLTPAPVADPAVEVIFQATEIAPPVIAQVFPVENVFLIQLVPTTARIAEPVPIELAALQEMSSPLAEITIPAQDEETTIAITAPAGNNAALGAEALSTNLAAVEEVSLLPATIETLAQPVITAVVPVKFVTAATPPPTAMAATSVSEPIFTETAAADPAKVETAFPKGATVFPVAILAPVEMAVPIGSVLTPTEPAADSHLLVKEVASSVADTAIQTSAEVSAVVPDAIETVSASTTGENELVGIDTPTPAHTDAALEVLTVPIVAYTPPKSAAVVPAEIITGDTLATVEIMASAIVEIPTVPAEIATEVAQNLFAIALVAEKENATTIKISETFPEESVPDVTPPAIQVAPVVPAQILSAVKFASANTEVDVSTVSVVATTSKQSATTGPEEAIVSPTQAETSPLEVETFSVLSPTLVEEATHLSADSLLVTTPFEIIAVATAEPVNLAASVEAEIVSIAASAVTEKARVIAKEITAAIFPTETYSLAASVITAETVSVVIPACIDIIPPLLEETVTVTSPVSKEIAQVLLDETVIIATPVESTEAPTKTASDMSVTTIAIAPLLLSEPMVLVPVTEISSTDAGLVEPRGATAEERPTSVDVPPEASTSSAHSVTETPDMPENCSGSIAEREYKKWNNAVEMPNNPYAPEALKRRISGSQERFIDLPNISPSTEKNPIDLIKSAESEIDADEQNRESDYKRYSRDYYINDDKQSTASSPKRKNSQDLLATLAISDDSTTDITINEPISPKLVEPETVYQALPAQVVEENASIETLSNQSLQSVNTTTSEDSDTVRIYDFNKQETTIIRDSKVTTETAPATATATTSIESATESCMESPKQFVAKQQRPTDLKFRSSASVTSSTIPSHSPFTPTRGSTPTAFKFLQPKRKLIEPGQVLSVDENEPQILTTPPGEKAVIEEEVAQVMPSVKALAQAFLLSSSKCSIAEKRWKSTIKASPVSPIKHISPTTNKKFEASPSTAEIAEDSTIASDLSSLETDPSIHLETETKDPKSPKTPITQEQNPTTSTTPAEPKQEQAKPAKTPSPLRRGFLKSNIAFFENLKFK